MSLNSDYGLPEGVGETAERRHHQAEERLEIARTDSERTNFVLDMLRSVAAAASELHVENGYAPKIRAIFRS